MAEAYLACWLGKIRRRQRKRVNPDLHRQVLQVTPGDLLSIPLDYFNRG